jgi:DNA polymerase-1
MEQEVQQLAWGYWTFEPLPRLPLPALADRLGARCLDCAQGTSADILKVAMVELHRRLTGPPYNCRLLLTVHDEVLLEVPQQHWPALEDDIKCIMNGVLGGKFGLQVKVAAGEDWYQCG